MRYNNFRGEYDANAQYEKNDVVIFDGAAYYRLFGGKGVSPIGKARRQVWQKMNETAGDVLSLVGGPGGGGGDTSGGKDGITPHIGPNGNWFLGSTDTGVKAQGEDGYTPSRGTDYWTAEDEAWMKGEIQTYVNNYLINGAW